MITYASYVELYLPIVIEHCILFVINFLYNNQINARALIGQSAVVYRAGKPTEKSGDFWITI